MLAVFGGQGGRGQAGRSLWLPGARSLEQVELLWMCLWDFGKTWSFPEPLLPRCKTLVKTSGPFVVDADVLIYQPK